METASWTEAVGSSQPTNRTVVAVTAVFVFVLLLLSVLYWVTPAGESDKFKNFWPLIASAAIVMTVASIIGSAQISYAQATVGNEQTLVTELQSNNQQVLSHFLDSSLYPYLGPLWAEMNEGRWMPPSSSSSSSSSSPGGDEQEDIELENKRKALQTAAAAMVFRTIEEGLFLVKARYNEPLFRQWTLLWRSWLRSRILRQEWSRTSGLYSTPMQLYVDTELLLSPPEQEGHSNLTRTVTDRQQR